MRVTRRSKRRVHSSPLTFHIGVALTVVAFRVVLSGARRPDQTDEQAQTFLDRIRLESHFRPRAELGRLRAGGRVPAPLCQKCTAMRRTGGASWPAKARLVAINGMPGHGGGIHVRGGLAKAKPHPILHPPSSRERRSPEPSKLIWHGGLYSITRAIFRRAFRDTHPTHPNTNTNTAPSRKCQ